MSMSDDDIRVRAHLLWEADGRPDGQSDHYWFRAREMLVQEGRAMSEGEGTSAFRPVDAAEAPPEPVGRADGRPAPSAQGGIASIEDPLPAVAGAPPLDPQVQMDSRPGEDAPVSEIDTIRRTLEVPKGRRGRVSPTDDRKGAMSGLGGSRQRS